MNTLHSPGSPATPAPNKRMMWAPPEVLASGRLVYYPLKIVPAPTDPGEKFNQAAEEFAATVTPRNGLDELLSAMRARPSPGTQ